MDKQKHLEHCKALLEKNGYIVLSSKDVREYRGYFRGYLGVSIHNIAHTFRDVGIDCKSGTIYFLEDK